MYFRSAVQMGCIWGRGVVVEGMECHGNTLKKTELKIMIKNITPNNCKHLKYNYNLEMGGLG